VDEFGEEVGLDLLQQIRLLEADFYRSEVWISAPDLLAMGDQAAAEFRALHPEVGEDAVRALAWCYMFDYK
jgi:hypothetical protein